MTMVLPYSEGLYASSPWFLRWTVTSETLLGCQCGGKGGEGERKNLWPSRMKDLIPLPRPVELALPPRATVSADKAALLPPKPDRVSVSICVYADATMCLLPLCPTTKVAGISLLA
jgi:hypothetical protein